MCFFRTTRESLPINIINNAWIRYLIPTPMQPVNTFYAETILFRNFNRNLISWMQDILNSGYLCENLERSIIGEALTRRNNIIDVQVKSFIQSI